MDFYGFRPPVGPSKRSCYVLADPGGDVNCIPAGDREQKPAGRGCPGVALAPSLPDQFGGQIGFPLGTRSKY